MDPMTSIGGRFVPPSDKDFSIRSRRLQLLVGEPYQKSQEWLSRLYGFANAYELRQALKQSASVGPFDEDLEDGGEERRHRLRLAVAYPRPEDSIAAFRRHLVADMGLFATPDGHETRHAQMTDQLAFFLGEKSASPYVTAGWSSQNEAVLHRTPLGEEVDNAIGRAQDEPDGRKRQTMLWRLAADHPDNPWVHAEILDDEMEVVATLTGLAQAVETRRLYRSARRLVTHFRRLYGDKEHLAIATKLFVRSPFGADAHGYALSLATAGKLAMAAGDHGDAARKFRRLRRMDRVSRLVPEPITIDPMGVSRFLDVALLNTGRGTSRRRIRPNFERLGDHKTTWRIYCDFAAKVVAKDLIAVRDGLADIVLLHGLGALRVDLAEALIEVDDRLRVPFPYLGRLEPRHFFLATDQLWRERSEVTRSVLAVLESAAVSRAGAALSRLESRGRESELPAAVSRLQQAIDAAWSHEA